MVTNEMTRQHLIDQIMRLNRENACLSTELCKYKTICYYYEKLSNFDGNSNEQTIKLTEQIFALKSVKSPTIRLNKLQSNEFNCDNNLNENVDKNKRINCSKECFNEVIENIISVIDEQIVEENRVCGHNNNSSDNRETDKTNNDKESILSDEYSNPDNDIMDTQSLIEFDISNAEQTEVIRDNAITNELNVNKNINIGFEMIGKQEFNACHNVEDICNENSNCFNRNPTQNNFSESNRTNKCKVCDANAIGKSYGIECCGGCKRFFYKSVKRRHQYSCGFDGNCIITPETRTSCQYCRYKKCIAMGMSAQSVGLGRVVKSKTPNNRKSSSMLAQPVAQQSSNDLITNQEENNDISCVDLNVLQDDNNKCKVCGDIVYVSDLGVDCCVSCKKFLSDALKSEQIAFSCIRDGNCLITPQTRSKCRYCRFNKCFELGVSVNTTIDRDRVSQKTYAECKVCGDNAFGDYNGAVCCKGCKSFFELSVLKQKKYSCFNDGNCVITRLSRNSCRYCRYNKCLSVGMFPESVRKRLGESLLVSASDKEQSFCSLTDTSMISNVNQSAITEIKDVNNTVNTDNNNVRTIDQSNNSHPNLRPKFVVNYNVDVDSSDESFVLPNDDTRDDDWSAMNNFEYVTNTYICDHVGCGKVFMNNKNLITHKKLHTNQTITCDHNGCGIILKNDIEYNNHMTRNHPELFPEINWMQCTEHGCAYKTKLSHDFTDHQKYHQRLKAKTIICSRVRYDNSNCVELEDESGLIVSKVNVNSRSQINKWKSRLLGCNEPFVCDERNCNGIFRSERGLSRHKIKTHGKPRLRVCGIDGCGFTEMRLDKFKTHQDRHRGIRRFKCDHDDCGKSFLTKHSLRHHKQWHSTELRYSCEWPGCDKRFKTSASLQQHRKYHSAIPVYQCDWPECGYGTANKWNLDKHKATHTGIQKYVCVWPSCEYKTANQSNLKTHIKMHNRMPITHNPKNVNIT